MKTTESGWVIPETLKTQFISGYTYNNLCKWTYCNRYGFNFEPENILENDLVFLNIDYFKEFMAKLNSGKIKNKFILVTQNSDRDFTKEMFYEIDRYVNKILAINCTYSHSKINKIPLGFNDQSIIDIDRKDLSFVEKSNLVYLNFRTHTHMSRYECVQYFTQFNWVTFENSNLSYGDFYDKLKTFKYSVAPRGEGIDTHRLYESLLFGVIPIVKRCELDELYSNLPIVLIDNWQDVTYDFLNDNYEHNLNLYFNWLSSNTNWYINETWIKV